MNRILLSVSILTMMLLGCDESSLEELETQDVIVENGEYKVETLELNTAKDETVEDVVNDKIYFLTESEKDYLGVAYSITDIEAEAIENVQRLVIEAKQNVALTNNEEHLKSLELAYVKSELALSLLNEMIETNNVPKIFNETHELLSTSIEQLLITKQYFIDGLIKVDNDIILEGLSHMDEAVAHYKEFGAELESVMEVYR